MKGWAKKLLSFIGKTLLIKHLLQPISIYHMMYVETPIGTTRYINKLFKYFLWGFSKDGENRKVPLIAWDRITQPREKSILGFKVNFTHLQALQSKWIAKALDDPSTQWASLFFSLLALMTWEQRRALNWAKYFAPDSAFWSSYLFWKHDISWRIVEGLVHHSSPPPS